MSYELSWVQTDQWRRQLEELYRSLNGSSLWIAWGCIIAFFLLAIFVFVAWCRIFVKADLPWERLFVPVYGEYWRYNLADCGRIFWILIACGIFAGVLPLLLKSLIPLAVLALAFLILQIVYLRKLAAAFGHGVWFTLGLIFLHPLFILILGFGKSEYSKSLLLSRISSRPQPKWTCSCGMVNPGTKRTCINCGRPHP